MSADLDLGFGVLRGVFWGPDTAFLDSVLDKDGLFLLAFFSWFFLMAAPYKLIHYWTD